MKRIGFMMFLTNFSKEILQLFIIAPLRKNKISLMTHKLFELIHYFYLQKYLLLFWVLLLNDNDYTELLNLPKVMNLNHFPMPQNIIGQARVICRSRRENITAFTWWRRKVIHELEFISLVAMLELLLDFSIMFICFLNIDHR